MRAVVTSFQAQPFNEWVKAIQLEVEQALQGFLPVSAQVPVRLHEAMRYAALDGGKRVRPLLVFAAGELFGAKGVMLKRVAAALEMVHVYSLVHDDLPCMDDDVLRRGKPTVHVQYDEATALLVGDALQSQAFSVLAAEQNEVPPARQVMLLRLLGDAAGSAGMCGGQAIDLFSVGSTLSLAQLEQMHRLKTGALLRASVLMGALCGKALSDEETVALDAYAAAVGLAFQVVDDVLDATEDSAALGKTAGKDAANNKPTYVGLLGLQASRELAEKLRQDAHAALACFGSDAQRLLELADLIVQRKN